MRLFIGNISFKATEDELTALFSECGTVDNMIFLIDRNNGKPRGFAFVDMPTRDALGAIEALNGHEFKGRALVVNEARPRDHEMRGPYIAQKEEPG